MNTSNKAQHLAATHFWRKVILPTLLALGAIGLSGCTTAKPAIVTANGIENATVGTRGYKLIVPPGYEIVRAESAAGSSDPRIKECSLIWNRYGSQEWIKSWNLRFGEGYFIYDKDVVFIFFAGCLKTQGVPLSDPSLRWQMKMTAESMVRAQMKSFKNKGMKGVKGRVVQNLKGRIEMAIAIDTLPPSRNEGGPGSGEFYIVLGDRNETFVLIGFAEAYNRGKMRLVFQDLVEHLDF